MKALRFYAPEDVRLEDVPEPECGPDEVKLKVKNCSTCGTDVKIFYNGHQNLTPPRITGHEIAGEVVEVGADVNATYGSDWKVGDRAQVIAAVPCGDCYECNKGWMAVCQNQTSVGYQYDGGFAEYMIVPRQVLKVDGLNRIPDNVGYDEASAAEPFACAINAQELLGIEEGDTVVVFGAGPIGCMHIRIARGVHKAGPVYLVDVNADRLEDVGRRRPPRGDHQRRRGRRRRAGHGADRRPRCRRDHHRHRRQHHPGAGDLDGRPQRPDLLLRRAAEDRPVHQVRLQPRALPPAAHPRRQRLGARAQQAGPASTSPPARCRSRT